ncbi:hypothetical protein P8452_01378 [Trifolium repens]|nr:hypothetical protein P8452_01378 [Trifolium repens]
MDCSERSNITILVVDHDEVSLAFVANILMERQYKVQTAKNARDALVTLRNNGGLFDIIITEFHVLGMNGFDFQKHIQNQFQVPVIMMSKDNRQHIISKTLENGATHFIVKPVCAEDFDDIQKYVVEAKKHKLFIDNLFAISDEEESSEQPKTKKEDCKRKSIDESSGGEEKYRLVKKSSRLVWTNELHNLFLDAIKKVGLKKAVPNKILEIMNIPDLTREHVASHLQKYRLNLDDKVAEKGTIGDISHRVLRSTLASNLPTSMIREIQEMRTEKLRALYQIGAENNVFNIFNNFPSNKNEFPYLQKPRLETNGFANTSFSSYGSRQGLMAASSSANFLKRDFQFGETSNQNHGSIGNGYFNHINHGVKNWNLESMNNSSILAQNVTCDARNNKRGFDSIGIRDDNANRYNFGLNVGGQNANVNFGSLAYKNFGLVQGGLGSLSMNKRGFDSIGIRDDNANSKKFGLNVGDQNANANVNFGTLGYENFGLVQGGFGSLSYVRGGRGSEFQDELLQGKVYENREIPLQKSDRNIVEIEQNHSGGTSTNVVESNQMEFDISNFSMMPDKDLLNKSQGDEQFSNGMLMGDTVFNASTSSSNRKLDMDLFEAVFGVCDDSPPK